MRINVVAETSFTVARDILEAAVPQSNERPSWVDHVIKYGDDIYLIVDVEEVGENIR